MRLMKTPQTFCIPSNSSNHWQTIGLLGLDIGSESSGRLFLTQSMTANRSDKFNQGLVQDINPIGFVFYSSLQTVGTKDMAFSKDAMR